MYYFKYLIYFSFILLANCSILNTSSCSRTKDAVTVTADKTVENQINENAKTENPNDVGQKGESKMYAVFHTNKGKFKALLHDKMAPKTVANFVGLAEGTKEFTDPKTGAKVKRPYYDGLTFHRIIENFMIQGGDPVGNGTGGPGYKFDDEFHPELVHDKKGVLSMANAGPNTNGSQFFITVAVTPHLDAQRSMKRGYSIFGQIVEGYDVVEAISQVDTDRADKPIQPVVINKLEIIKD
jgi:peptidyl-prolyl cis-trans isomerase A (cyclophilin A)